jgi:hypothetical protein
MATIKYVDPGSMDKTIDIWDRPPNSLPVLFASGIAAQLLPVASTTQSTAAPALGQATSWPRLPGPQIALVTMSIIIRYLAGVKSSNRQLHTTTAFDGRTSSGCSTKNFISSIKFRAISAFYFFTRTSAARVEFAAPFFASASTASLLVRIRMWL